MANVKKLVLIEFTPEQMFALVDQCENYPQFLPWCSSAEMHERTDIITAATININYHGLKTHFSTRNTKKYPTEMLINLTDGPFTHFEGSWHFTPLGDKACKIEFTLQYEFSSKLMEKVLGPVFSYIANTLVDSFIKRASQVYARSPS